MEDQKTSFFQHTLRWGLILGAISVALTAIAYAVDYAIMVNWKYGLFSFAVFIGCAIFAGINYRSQEGGFLSFKSAFLHALIVFAVSGLLSTIFSILLYTVVDPQLPQKLVDVTITNTEEMMGKFGMPEDKMDEALEKARTDTAARFTTLGLIKGYFWIVVMSAVFSLIVGLIVRKRKPDDLS